MKHSPFALIALVCGVIATPLCAQIGNNNPTGSSGICNGQAGVCGYDPYTGNATRSIIDIAVSGAVGEYPLALVRTANSRTPSITGVFGWDGGWNHNYNWTMDDSPVTHTQNFSPVKYTVNFPDGRVETFRAVTWDSTYRVRPGPDTIQSTSSGVRERFLQLNLNNMYAYLILPDGGAVEFRAQQNYDPAYGRYWYTYHVTGIYDPHGLKTTIDSEVVSTIRRITRVTEPAGRYLQFTYSPTARRRITQVQEFINGVAKRRVQYNYSSPLGQLINVVYYDNPSWTATYQYTGSNIPGELPFLLYTCDDPMYPGPMHKIAYTYRTANNYGNNQPGYGQISSENYYDGATVGVAVSTMTAPSATTRVETRGDGETRSFTYTTDGFLTSCTDFMYHIAASQGYDNKKYVNYVTDRRGNRTDYTNDPITGNVLQIQFPFTHEDTLNQSGRPSISYIYGGGVGCADPNNQNPYWICTATDEAANQTRFTRDPVTYRVTRIDYPDGGWETFSYDANHFYQLQSHRMVTGGTENWTYDARHRIDTYRNPDSPSPSPSPSAQYYYDTLDRVSGITDALNHSTNFDYNDRGQLTLITLPWFNGNRYTISNVYNSDGTLQKTTDELNHFTSYTYDNYRRLKSVTLPVRGSGDNGTYSTSFYYGDNPWDGIADYKLTDSNVTWVVPPSSSFKKVHTVYDDNRRTSSVTMAPTTSDEATTSYTYDNVGNVTWVTRPLGHNNVHTLYDERNRPYQITVGPSQTTTIWYDTSGHLKEIDRANGQVITYDTFDAMNRVSQQSASNTRLNGGQSLRTSYSYYPSGPANLLNTFRDAHLFGGTDQYTYSYDGMGRKRSLQYPFNGNNVHRTEQWSYDNVGRLGTFTNRDNPGKVQTFSYDALNRVTGFTWNDGGITPSVSFGYDAASRLISINNANATISRTYFNDNLLKSETETATGGVSRAINYTYDADGNRASLAIPGYTLSYDYTKRNQLQHVINNNANIASYVYDLRGNVISRTLNSNSTSSDFSYDVYDRVTAVNHNLASGTRTIQYGYDDTNHSNNRLWAKRVINAQSPENNKGEVFSYDLADQVSAFQLDVLNPNQVPQPQSQTMVYDPNGNRQFTPNGQYAPANALSQYTTRTIAGVPTTAGYDLKGNTTTGLDNSTYSYDAQNRVLTAQKPGGPSMSITYDGLNRQVSRTFNGTTTYSVWDGWNLVQEYHVSQRVAAVDATYVYGAIGLVRDMESPNHYYYQDASGSTSHVANNSGSLMEWYRYDLDGNPIFYDATDHIRTPNQSGYSVRHLFTGQQWYQDVGLYDLRNRFYCPDVGRFLQPDPIGFGVNNLYRYCHNNPVTRGDRFGLQDAVNNRLDLNGQGGTRDAQEVVVTGSYPIDPGGTGAPSGGGGGGGGGEPGGRGGSVKLTGIAFSYGKPRQNSNSTQQQPPGIMVPFDIYHPTTTAEFIIAGNIIEGGDTTDTRPAIDVVDFISWGIAGLLRSSIISSVAARGISTPYGRAFQATTAETKAALRQMRNGATVYKGGVLGRSQTSASQFFSLESPLNPGYAGRYGIPAANANFNFILSGRVKPGAPLITRPAAGVASDVEAGIEGVTTPGSFIIDSFYMPD